MITFLTRATAFVAISVTLLLGLEWFLTTRIFEDPRPKYATLFDRGIKVRNLILGPSTLAYGLNPDYLTGHEGPFHNFAMSGVSPTFSLAWYKLFRRYHDAPSAVVLSADGFTFGTTMHRRIEQDACYMPLPVAFDVALRPEAYTRESLNNALILLREKKRLENLLTGQPLRIELAAEHHVRGYAPIRNWPFVASAHQPLDHAPAQEAAYVQLIQLLQSEGVQVAMVQAPVLLTGNDYQDDLVRLRAVARAHGVPFLNYNQERRSSLNQRQEAFYDVRHLNQRGAEAFGPMLAADLRALGWPRPRASNPRNG